MPDSQSDLKFTTLNESFALTWERFAVIQTDDRRLIYGIQRMMLCLMLDTHNVTDYEAAILVMEYEAVK